MIYKRLFTLSSYFLAKESYDWWITRRKWGFKQQISERTQVDFAAYNMGYENFAN